MSDYENPDAVLMVVRSHLHDADEYIKQKEYDKAKTSAEQAIDVARRNDHTPSLAAAYYGLASVIWNSGGSSEDAHHYATLAAQHTKANTTTDLLARTLIARLKAARGNYEAALILNHDLLNYYRENERLDGQADILRSLGDVYLAKGEYEQAREYYFESMNLYRQIADPLNYCGLLVSLGSLYFQMDDREQARRYWREARAVAEANGFRHILEAAEAALELS